MTFLGVVNHWVTLLVHKTAAHRLHFYFLDSGNLSYLDKLDEQLPEVMLRRSREKQKYGMKPASPFMTKMSIQSLFDLRKVLELLTDLFLRDTSITQYYANGSLHNMLKQFHQFTETLNPSQAEQLAVPQSRMFSQVRPLSEEEEKSLKTFDFTEFLYPYKKVRGGFSFLRQLSTKDQIDSVLDMLILFTTAGTRPQHIEADVSRNLHAFGREGFFPSDLEILEAWCQALIHIDAQVESHF